MSIEPSLPELYKIRDSLIEAKMTETPEFRALVVQIKRNEASKEKAEASDAD